MTEPRKPICPRCGGRMFLHGKTPGGKQRYCCYRMEGPNKVICYVTTNPWDSAARDRGARLGKIAAVFKRKLSGNRYVITSAQNATPVHEGFLNALECYCLENDAELVVIPIRYKNPTSKWSNSQENSEVWDGALVPYLYNQRKKLTKRLVLLGDIKTRPTADSPLTGFEGITHGESGILGHSKIQFRTIPTPHASLPKIMTTTGSVTVRNYTDSKAGKKGAFHHTFAATLVETHGKTFHLRQLIACDDGSFMDIVGDGIREYLPDGTSQVAPSADALVMGDTHHRYIDPKVEKATFGKGGLVDVTDPKILVWHDLLDGDSRNPHHRDDVFTEIGKRSVEGHIVRYEVEDCIYWLLEKTKDRTSIIVPSNHLDFFRRWIDYTDWRRDPDNAEFYLRTALHMVESVQATKNGYSVEDPFTYWVERLKGGVDVRCLRRDESFRVGPFELSMHGDKGPNGARGSIKNLSRLGTRVISGHGHSPALEEGHVRVGTSSYLKLDYNVGPSSWMQTHAIAYANGKATLVNFINGKWRRG